MKGQGNQNDTNYAKVMERKVSEDRKRLKVLLAN